MSEPTILTLRDLLTATAWTQDGELLKSATRCDLYFDTAEPDVLVRAISPVGDAFPKWAVEIRYPFAGFVKAWHGAETEDARPRAVWAWMRTVRGDAEQRVRDKIKGVEGHAAVPVSV